MSRASWAGTIFGAVAILATPALAAVDGPKVNWNVSLWGPPRAFTAGVEAFAKYMGDQTGGKFDIKLHYGGALSKGPDNLDNIKLGAFEMAATCAGYHPGKHPGMGVLDLPGLPLTNKKVHELVHEAVFKHPEIVKEYKRWNAMPILSALQPQSEIMGTGEPPMKMEDFKGMRVRALGGTGDALRNLGAVPTSVPAPEVYNGIERGIFRAAAFPFSYSFAAYKINEIGKWFTTNLAPGANNCPTVVNLAALNKLPEQYKKLIPGAKAAGYKALAEAQNKADAKNIPEWKAKGLVAIEYPASELEKFRKLGAAPVWQAWVKKTASRAPAQELLDFVLAEAEKAKKQLGVK